MKTILTHIYNEEYLLPWWLNHHKQFFDHGIIVDYQSTDRSLDIVRLICPTWKIIHSRNLSFEAHQVDEEITDIERSITGWRCCLTATEFLIGNYRLLDDTPMLNYQVRQSQYLAPCIAIVDENYMHTNVDSNRPLYEQFTHGVKFPGTSRRYFWRSIHNHPVEYTPGRHFKSDQTLDECQFIVTKYNYAPMTVEGIKRKSQIQYRIPPSDMEIGRGHHHHNYGKGLTEADIKHAHHLHKLVSTDYKQVISKFLGMQ